MYETATVYFRYHALISCLLDPDNYTDPETFLDHLQRNPRLRPYDFWPLVADSTVIVQHVCSVAIFICAYAGIYQDRISPISVVSCGSLCTVFGWILWDYWMGQAEKEGLASVFERHYLQDTLDDGSSTSSTASLNPLPVSGNGNGKLVRRGLGLSLSTTNLTGVNGETKALKSRHYPSLSKASIQSISPIDSLPAPEPSLQLHPTVSTKSLPTLLSPISRQASPYYSPTTLSPSLSPRTQARLKTLKSAILIYFALLGLSPILKSLTKSTSSDSIWALATWLLIINIFFFDYGGLYVPSKLRKRTPLVPTSSTHTRSTVSPINDGVRAPPFPSSLSTNAALMASTVLASRLPSTTHVFSLTLFSIEVFGLFPVFRRHLRHESWLGHVLLTAVLIAVSSASMGLVLAKSYTHTYGVCGFCWGWIWHVVSRSLLGFIIGGLGTTFVMGGCSWWLIGLQRYKNVVTGPWDPARPILTGGTHRGRGSTE